jgi:hypothetical protein
MWTSGRYGFFVQGSFGPGFTTSPALLIWSARRFLNRPSRHPGHRDKSLAALFVEPACSTHVRSRELATETRLS